MKRKLRKSLSWLLTVAMIFSLFCGMIPTASAVPGDVTFSEGNYVDITYYNGIGGKTNLTVNVVDKDTSETLEILSLGEAYCAGGFSTTISLKESQFADYQIADVTGDGFIISGLTIGSGDDTRQEVVFSWVHYSDSTEITVYLEEAENVLELKNSSDDIGTITYTPGDVNTNINVYLNNSDKPIVTFKNVGIQNAGAMNFVLNLKSGYFYGDARRSMECDPVGTTWTNQRYITFGQPNQTNTLDLYFFTFEDGVNLDFERTVNMNAAGDLIDEACPNLTVSYTLDGKTYTITHDTWDQTGTIYVPKNTMIYVSPNIQSGFGFQRWEGHDSWVTGNSIYTLDADGNIVDTDSVVVGRSEDMALYYGAPGYTDGEVYLRMRDGSSGYEFYTVTYDANEGKGTMSSQTFSEYPVYIRNNEFTREGCTFTGWNTKDDGTGTTYKPNDVYSTKADVTLYAQWQEAGTEPTPGEEYKITVFTKELVDDPEDVPNGLDREDYTFPENNIVTVPVNSSVTLLYKLTVTGDVGANYTISDDDATLVNGLQLGRNHW